jgi:hypothetical protein
MILHAESKKTVKLGPSLMAHTCNPSYLGGEDRGKTQDPIRKLTEARKKKKKKD